ncbi:2,3-dimethylmalate lyase [Variovorax sp. PBL-H6]|uniref:isocitrate lyase/PEP mutase family protein n=1 Tax=Variovorax sp. PBL-H6 TaxID=434009 RepID=UPI0013191DC2|nr:oxaloacetate decarboxylase [Variovorax sp. PBL-H6]VTU33513.1 2,3-dimethylmalate lyase [Variovorax sp. PBL-H6]
MIDTLGATLRHNLEARNGMLVPGAANALAARVIEDLGFDAVYISGAGVANTYLGVPDIGLVGLAEMVQHTQVIRDACDLPLIVDADTGYGNALNVRHAVRSLERAGANAIQLEDQVMPKKCGHFAGKAVVETAEMLGKIKAAVDARHSRDFLIIARTDARAIHGLDAALERAAAFAAAGADLTFVEAPESPDELARIARELQCPQVANMVIGGRTPALPAKELGELGFGMVLYANAALQAALQGMIQALSVLRNEGILSESSHLIASFQERQRIVRKDEFDAMEDRYATGSPPA